MDGLHQTSELVDASSAILVLTGAGISVSSGIPDFRSSTGLYAELKREADESQRAVDAAIPRAVVTSSNDDDRPPKRPRRSAAEAGTSRRKKQESPFEWIYDLNDPQEIMDIRVFRERPQIFYSFANKLYPGSHEPSATHRWLGALHTRNKLLRNYTQNIDGLESKAGVPPDKVVHCHGSFDTATCLRCKKTFPGTIIETAVFEQSVPPCPTCRPRGKRKVNSDLPSVLKPDITFFHEAMRADYTATLETDLAQTDLLIIIGTSLSVEPVKSIPKMSKAREGMGGKGEVPIVLINRESVRGLNPNIWLKGDCDDVVRELSKGAS